MWRSGALLAIGVCGALFLRAETGYDAWLRYAPLTGDQLSLAKQAVPAVVVVLGDEVPTLSARDELIRGIRGMLGRTLRIEKRLPDEPAIVLGTVEQIGRAVPGIRLPVNLAANGYYLKTESVQARHYTVIAGADAPGVVYGAFAFLRKLATGESVENLDDTETPYASIRWINQWDNLDGSIERGYGGRSVFWEGGESRDDLSRVKDYARMLASLGVNGCSINNVNADRRVLAPEFVRHLKRIAEAFRPWGIRVVVSVDFASPQSLGGLNTFDPLDPQVAQWWKTTVDALYRDVPDLAGFVMKADSEGRAGPSVYGRTHADAANVVARALQPHGGLLLYRGFVYNHHMDWRDPKNDRARAAVDNFKGLDGKFDRNVVVQIKNGPIDFQVREPVSPLLGTLQSTNIALELQITQEYFGQARHTVFLVPQWKEVLDFDLQAAKQNTPVAALAAGKVFGQAHGGVIGVANVGLDENWLGNHLSQANLYGWGRLAWNPALTPAQIVDEWTRLTFGNDPEVLRIVTDIQLHSWRAYEDYTGPLGLQTLTDIVGNHFGVSVEASEHNGWGQWHNADRAGVGMDRTVATGTGFIGQYRPPVARLYETLAACPDDLLLFFHHVPYGHMLHSGKTVIQSIYDSHYDGANAAERFLTEWQTLKGRVDDRRFQEIEAQLTYQAGGAVVWRDAVANYFSRLTGIADQRHRVGNHPSRIEAESMTLQDYTIEDVKPWEAASGGKALSCPAQTCEASFRFGGPPGWYNLHVQYFDQNSGIGAYTLQVASQSVDAWKADDHLPSAKLDGSTSTRRNINGVALRPGDEIRIRGIPDSGDKAALDYVEIESTAAQLLRALAAEAKGCCI